MVRGVAIIMVVIYHLAWDLGALAGWDINMHSGFWHYFQRVTATIFILLVGLSLTLGYSRGNDPTKKSFSHYLRRGLKLFGWGMVITVVTWLLLRRGYVQFGILHFIGLAIVIAFPFLRLGFINLGVGLMLMVLGNFTNGITVLTAWLVWLGFMPEGYYAVDYFPLIPWFGLVLIGIFLGNMLNVAKLSIRLPDLSPLPPIAFLSLLGRKSLLIYLIHQPILILSLVLIGVIDPGSLL